MGGHGLKVTYAIFLSETVDHRFVQLVIACARSIRRFEDTNIAVLALEPFLNESDEDLLRSEGLEIWKESPIDVANKRRFFNNYELSKIRVWKHTEYDKIVLLDADNLATAPNFQLFELPEFTCCKGKIAPLNGAAFVLEPSVEVYTDLIDLILWPQFTIENGWRQHGQFDWNGEISNWNFNAAGSTQGLFYYYFHLLHGRAYFNLCEKIRMTHISQGQAKWESIGDYKEQLDLVGVTIDE